MHYVFEGLQTRFYCYCGRRFCVLAEREMEESIFSDVFKMTYLQYLAFTLYICLSQFRGEVNIQPFHPVERLCLERRGKFCSIYLKWKEIRELSFRNDANFNVLYLHESQPGPPKFQGGICTNYSHEMTLGE